MNAPRLAWLALPCLSTLVLLALLGGLLRVGDLPAALLVVGSFFVLIRIGVNHEKGNEIRPKA